MNKYIKKTTKLVCYGIGLTVVACGLGTMAIVVGTNVGIIAGELVRALHG